MVPLTPSNLQHLVFSLNTDYNNNSLKLYLLHWSQQTDNKMLSSLAYWKDNSHLIIKVPAHKRMRTHIVEYVRDAFRIHVPVCVI